MKPYVTEGTMAAKTDAWLKAIGPHNTHKMSLNAGASALLIVDIRKKCTRRAS